VFKSLHQAITGTGTAFKRTPKVKARTSTPATYILFPCLLALFSITGAAWSFGSGSPLQGIASGLNGGLLVYAVGAFVGWRYSWEDLAARLRTPNS
jgi:cellulose synthase (UDP-forming)